MKRKIFIPCYLLIFCLIVIPVSAFSRDSSSSTGKKAVEERATEENENTEAEISLLWKATADHLKAGETFRFKVKITGTDEKVKWTLSNAKIATLSQKGVFKGKIAGKVTVTARAGKKKIEQLVVVSGKKKIAIDAGHQTRANLGVEPIGPGAKQKKMKVSGGCTGVATHVPEYKFNLRVAKKLRKELLARGYEVFMVRTTNNVNITNMERALKTNKSGSDVYIRIHADSNNSSKLTGASAFYPSKHNPYVSSLSAASYKLTKAVLDAYCQETGIKSRGCIARDDLTGTNWSKIPVTLIECGFMSNPSEDRKLQNTAFQKKIAIGMANGIDDYFGF